MTLLKAHKILIEHDIYWTNYFDLVYINTSDIKVKEAINRVKTFITMGK
jgi:hypothetical protein